MDFDSKYREKFPSYHHHHLPLYFHDNYSKPRDDQFNLEGVLSSKVTNNFLQDFHPLENVNLNGSSTSNSMLQTNFLESFDNPSYGCLPAIDFYEIKPFENHAPNNNNNNNGVLVPLLENFNQSEGGSARILGHSHMMNNPITMLSPINSQSYTPLNYYEFGPTKFRPSDDDSCTTPNVGGTMVTNTLSMATTTTTTTMLRKGGRGRKKKTNVVKGQWTVEEDRLLMQLVERYGIRKWSQIAQLLQGRIGKQCRERWHNHLRPDIKKDVWSEEEDRILIKAHTEIGNKWAEIAKKLPGRTENSIKNHWNATKRRQFSRRKCKSKFPKQSSLLQEYIKSLTPETINAGCRKKPPSMAAESGTHMPLRLLHNYPADHAAAAAAAGSSNSSSSEQLGPEFDFSEVPDFNFDAQMFEESSIDSLLDYTTTPHDQHANACYDHHYEQSEIINDIHIGLCSMVQPEVKREFDLADMINQVNL